MSLSELDKGHRKAKKEHEPPLMVNDILARLRQGKSTVSEIRMGDQIIPVRVLSADEVNSIRNEAKVKMAKKGGDQTDENLYIQMRTLMEASKISGDPVGFLNEKLITLLTVDEISYLYNELINFWETFNPSLEQISPEYFRELVEALKKNTRSWSDCSLPERRAIFTCFVDLIRRQDTPISPQAN